MLRWRLGTPLPEDFPEHLPTGEAYPSGTAFEILSAVARRKAGGELPDVFVFRYSGGAPNPRLEEPGYADVVRQWEALKAFFGRWFVTTEGRFVAAFNPYASEDEFEAEPETLLRNWLAERVAGGRALAWPPTLGSPFRALDPFGHRHAPVFFGRSADIRRASEVLREAGQKFLAVLGASGSGKSSLARAGLVPRLTAPGVVAEVDLWRVAAMRPGDSAEGPFAALAAAPFAREADLPPGEAGRGDALPEIGEGDCKTPAELAALLAHADHTGARAVVNALQRIGERQADTERLQRVRADLALIVDQLEEIFAPSIAAEAREKFAELLARLVATGRVWVVATLRADLYAAVLEVPALKRLKDAGAAY
ncbi:MAG: hypothetical protein ACLPN5_03915, partial [Roseiarcus sp.]